LSITGGAQKLTIDEETKALFKGELVKAAKNTKAWIITGVPIVELCSLLVSFIKTT
jgi:hypothetical protein